MGNGGDKTLGTPYHTFLEILTGRIAHRKNKRQSDVSLVRAPCDPVADEVDVQFS